MIMPHLLKDKEGGLVPSTYYLEERRIVRSYLLEEEEDGHVPST